MRFKIIFLAFCLLFPAYIGAGYHSQRFHQGEWEMKTAYWQKLHERQSNPTVLDQTDFDVKYIISRLNSPICGTIDNCRVIMTSQMTTNDVTSVDYDLNHPWM